MSGKDPIPNALAYQGVRATNPPNLIKATRAPASSDTKYPIGTLWVNTSSSISYQLTGFSAGAPVWVFLGALTPYVTASVAKASAVALTNATTANVTSISLTAGTWSVSGLVIMSGGAITGTIFEAGSSTTTATLGTLGTTDSQTSVMATAGSDSGLAIPPSILTLTSTTTVFLVVNVTFSGGSATAYGSITAQRIA